MTVKLQVDLVMNSDGTVAATAIKKVGDAAKEADVNVEKLRQGAAAWITAASTAYLALKDALESIAHVMEVPIRNAIDAESANAKLATTMEAVGKYSTDAYEGMLAYAKQLSELSGFSQEAVKAVLEQNLAMGMSAEQAQLATKAAAGLAKVSHQDLMGASEAFLAAMEGQTKGLKKWIDGVDGLTLAQLRTGAAYPMGLGVLSKFIANDAASTAGALDRLSNGLRDIANEAGDAFLKGVGLPNQYGELKKVLEDLNKAVVDAKPAFQALGAEVGGAAVGFFKELVEVFKILGPELPHLTAQFVDLMKYGLIPFINLWVSWQSIVAHMRGDTALENKLDQIREHLTATFQQARTELNDFKGSARENEMTAADWDAFVNAAALEGSLNNAVAIAEANKRKLNEALMAPRDLAKAFADNQAAIMGGGAQMPAPAAAPGATVGELRRTDDTHNMADSFGQVHKKLTAQQIQERDQMLRTLNDMTVQANSVESNELIAAMTQREQKIEDLEKQASDKGFSIAGGALKLRLAMQYEFAQKLAVQYSQDQVTFSQQMGNQVATAQASYSEQLRLHNEMVVKERMSKEQAAAADAHSDEVRTAALLDFVIAVATAEGDTTKVIKAEYEKQAAAFKEMLDQGIIDKKDYIKIIQRLEEEKDAKSAKTTGDDSTDKKLAKVGAVMGSVKDGVNSTIAAIGSMYGPIGQIVAGIIQTLNQTPAAFRAMLDSLDKMWAELLPNIMTNITVLIEHFPTALARILGTWFDVNMWSGFLANLKIAFVHLFTNLWKEIFTGGRLDEDLSSAVNNAKKITFGNNDPNAGDNAFKIKDISGTQAQTVDSASDKFGTTVAESTKGLFYYFAEAWHNLLGLMSDWWLKLEADVSTWGDLLWKGFLAGLLGDPLLMLALKTWGGTIWSGITAAESTLGDWGTKIWKGFIGALSDGLAGLVSIFGKMGGWIFDGLNAAIKAIQTVDMKGFGTAIWNALKSVLDPTAMAPLGAAIWSALKTGIDPQTFKDMGSKVWEGTSAAMIAAAQTFRDMGSKIFEGLSKSLNDAAQLFRDMGGKIWEGLSKGLSTITSAAGGTNPLHGIVPGAEHGGMILSNGLQSDKLASAFASMGAMKFEGGGTVPGTGFRDSVPAVLRGGEVVSTPEQVRDGIGGKQIVFNFNVAAGAPRIDRQMVKDELMPQVMEFLNRESRNGKPVTRRAGVY